MADPKDPKEDDKVAAAYENISKKLESLRNGKEIDDEDDGSGEAAKQRSDGDDSEDELEEWKGPKPMKNPDIPEDEEDEMDIRRVKLENSENEKEEDSEDEEDDDSGEATKQRSDGDDIPEEKEVDGDESEPAKKWKPDEEDPLGEEDLDEESKESKDSEESEDKLEEEAEVAKDPDSEDLEKDAGEDVPERKTAQPDSLDDLTEGEIEEQTSKDSDEDDYFIPNLKGTGQRINNEYNKPIERERSSESYQKSSMDNQNFSSNNDPGNFFSQHSQTQTPKRASKFHLLILVIIGIVVIGFTVYILKGGFGDLSLTTKPSPSPSPVESASPTPTPTPEPERSKFKVRVLNGSGKTGLAASVSAKLKELGYQVDKTGNATNSAFTQTVVRVKTEVESFIPQIVKDLLPDFDAAGNTSLKDDDAVDIEIILGAK